MTDVLVDTNVLVYAHDPREPAKQARAIQVLDGLHSAGRGSLSVQSLAEFFVATTRGGSPRVKPMAAARQVERFVAAWRVLNLTPAILLEAARGVTERKLSYFDRSGRPPASTRSPPSSQRTSRAAAGWTACAS